ncbi:MAG: hypothetical protein GY851_36560 [bacterium]|nr:hypothetical protein [bacterium]
MDPISRRSFIAGSVAGAATLGVAGASSSQTEDTGMAKSAQFQAGIAVRDITPGPDVGMWGYSDRPGPSTGTLDPLHARALALKASEATAVIVTLDLGRVPLPEACARIKARAKAVGVDHVILTASHTHHAPAMDDPSQDYLGTIEKSIGDAIEDAVGHLAPARIGVGRSDFDIGHNRRIVTPDDECIMIWRNEDRLPTEPVDHEAGLIRIDTADGTTLALLVNHACHPVVMGPDNRQFSADWPGEMARLVKESTGAECLFLQGGCGDINPYLDKTPLPEGGVDAMRSVGRAAAESVIAAFGGIETAVPEAPTLAYDETPVEVGRRWNLDDPAQQEFLKAVYGAAFDTYVGQASADMTVPLGALVLNGNLALAFMPGEIFVQFQKDLKERSPVRDTFLCGYALEFHAYFPTVRDAAVGGYGGSVATYVGVGAGEKLTTEAMARIGRLAGTIRPLCGPEDLQMIDFDPDKHKGFVS